GHRPRVRTVGVRHPGHGPAVEPVRRDALAALRVGADGGRRPDRRLTRVVALAVAAAPTGDAAGDRRNGEPLLAGRARGGGPAGPRARGDTPPAAHHDRRRTDVGPAPACPGRSPRGRGPMNAVVVAVALSLVSAVAYAAAAVAQERLAARAPATGALRLLGSGAWWWAVTLNASAALLHVVALG